MGSVFVEDPTIGNMLARAMAPTDVAGTYLKGLQARDLLDKQKAADKYIESNAAYWNAQQPPPYSPPSQGIPWEGPPSPVMQQERTNFNLLRNLQLDTAALGARGATSMSDVAGAAPKLFGQTSIGLTPPQSTSDLIKLNAQIEGKIPDVLFDPTKTQLTPALAQTRMRTYEEKVARGEPTTDAENRTYASDVDFVNPNKTKVGDNQTSIAREQQLSAAQQAALRRAAGTQVGQPTPDVPVTPTTTGQRPANVEPAALTPAPVSGTGAGVTTQTEGPRAPPQVGEVINGFRYMGGNPNDKNSYAPVQPGAPAAPATPAGTRTVIGPDGQPITVQQTGDPKASTELQAKLGIAVPLAQKERMNLENLMQVRRDEKGAIIVPPPRAQGGYYVPTGPASFVSRNFGNSEMGQGLAQTLDRMGQPAGVESKIQEYAQVTDRWIEQVVRLVSGATVLPSERANYRAMFMPNAQDEPAQIAQKLEAMRLWELAASSSMNSAETIAKMKQVTAGDPVMRTQIDALERRAMENNALARPFR